MTPIFNKFSSLRKGWEADLQTLENKGKSLELSTRNKFYASINKIKERKAEFESSLDDLKKDGEKKAEMAKDRLESLSSEIKSKLQDAKNTISNQL